MRIELSLPLVDEILEDWRSLIGDEYMAYRNHIYRMLHFCFALQDCSAEDKEKLMIAACFHDLGIWIDDTVDYIPPSIPPAMSYLEKHGHHAWNDDIRLMISEHHKLTAYDNPKRPLVELFRRGDLVDFSLGLVRFGLPRASIRQVQSAFPNAGFHKFLAKIASRWVIKHPLNPLPMMKW